VPKITPKDDKKPNREGQKERKTIVAQTTDKTKLPIQSYQWQYAQNDHDLAFQLISTGNYLQKTQQYRVKGASIFSRIYSGKGLMNYALNSKILDTSNQLPVRRPTMNVTQSCIDTLVSRITQAKPKPTFLTEEGSYKEQSLAKQYNAFIAGEFYRNRAYEKGTMCLRDSCVFADGFLKVIEKNNKVAYERTLATELFADKDDSWYGDPRTLIQFKLSDRATVANTWPDAKLQIAKASKAYVDGSGESSETISDQIILVEGWHLPSGEGAGDGRHAIVCSDGVIFDDKEWDKETFPFVRMPFNPHSVGWFSQGLVEQLMGTQLGIDTLLRTISEAINIVGVPMVFIDELSKIVEAHLNNRIGNIVKYRGTMPSFQTPPCIAPEMYEHLMRLIGFAYQIAGISQLASGGVKPPGLNSGEAQRVFLDNQDDRFASLEQRYNDFYIDLAYQTMDKAQEICEREGSYSTVYPSEDGTRLIELPKAGVLKDTYVIQCYNESSLPRDPAGRYAQLAERLASGIITLEEFRALDNFPDLKESDKLGLALRNRILKMLSDIVEDGKKPAPDVFMLDPTDLATTLAVQYINVYSNAKLEEKKMDLLRNFVVQIQTLKQQAVPPPVVAPTVPVPQGPNAAPAPAQAPVPQSVVSAQ
jgi:hypothetical protein